MTKIALATLALAALLAGCVPASAGPRTVEIVIEHSRFIPDHFSFRQGEKVRFVVINNDPISHELIIGDEEVQLVHENGTEAHHGAKPGEVTVPSGTARSTTYVFSQLGSTLFGCHAPNHYAYGMRGTIEVLPALE